MDTLMLQYFWNEISVIDHAEFGNIIDDIIKES